MTNQEIIMQEVLKNKVFTKEEVKQLILEHGELPIHTFEGWKERGYTVKKGEHARIITKLWKMRRTRVKEEENEEEEQNAGFILTKAFLFTFEQVEKTVEKIGNDDINKKQEQKKNKRKTSSRVFRNENLKYFADCQTLADLKKAYRKLAKQYHPDNLDGGNVEIMKQISREYGSMLKKVK